MPEYREKLWAAPWVFVATALVIPASILVLAPISMLAGVVTAIVLYGACALLFTLGSPTVSVSGGILTAGQASVQTEFLGEAVAFEGAEATAERGTRLDVRAWLLIRGWISPVVRIPVRDTSDPTPYWLVSSRRPHELAAAINGSRRPVTED